MRLYRPVVAVLLHLLALLWSAAAMAAPNHIAAELVAEGPAGADGTVWLALHMRPEKGWHGYWLNPGDAGKGMTLEWSLPPGATAGTPHYPVPETLLVSGLMNHVYNGDHAVLVPIRLPSGAAAGPAVPVSVTAQWLACTEALCVPEEAALSVTLRPGAGARDPRFDAWRQKLPAPLGAPAHFALSADRVRLAIPLPASARLAAPHLFLAEDKVLDYAARQRFSRAGDLLVVEVPRAKFAPASPGKIGAVLRLSGEGDLGLSIEALPGAVPPAGEPLSEADAPAAGKLPLLLLGALLGGLLLNVMPCVFPILSLKALSLARAGESAGEAQREGLAYTAGVVLACLALGALLLALRAAGQEVGWAFQLQEPAVVVALLLLAAAITANLAGLFEFTVPGFANKGSPQGAFATGLLAAFVATPCTGPFMATAMGAALLLPTGQALLLFAALGLGIALPFLAIAFVPALRRMLPRPGAWMATFRRWMALPMGLTALALLWLCAQLGGAAFAGLCTLLAAGLIAALAKAGREQRAGRSVARRLSVDAVLLLIVASLAAPYVFVPQSGRQRAC